MNLYTIADAALAVLQTLALLIIVAAPFMAAAAKES